MYFVQEDEDLDSLEKELDMFSGKRKGRRSMEKVKPRRSGSEEERKKYAAIECLAAVTDEVWGIMSVGIKLAQKLKLSSFKKLILKARRCTFVETLRGRIKFQINYGK